MAELDCFIMCLALCPLAVSLHNMNYVACWIQVEMQSGLFRREHLFLVVQSDAYFLAAQISWTNICVPLSSSPKGSGPGACEFLPSGVRARRENASGPVPHPCAEPHLSMTLLQGICPTLSLTYRGKLCGRASRVPSCLQVIPHCFPTSVLSAANSSAQEQFFSHLQQA